MDDLLNTAFENCGANGSNQGGISALFANSNNSTTPTMGQGVMAFFN